MLVRAVGLGVALQCHVACGLESVRVNLKSIHLSHGVLKPSFNIDTYEYTVDLPYPYASLAVTPEFEDLSPQSQQQQRHSHQSAAADVVPNRTASGTNDDSSSSSGLLVSTVSPAPEHFEWPNVSIKWSGHYGDSSTSKGGAVAHSQRPLFPTGKSTIGLPIDQAKDFAEDRSIAKDLLTANVILSYPESNSEGKVYTIHVSHPPFDHADAALLSLSMSPDEKKENEVPLASVSTEYATKPSVKPKYMNDPDSMNYIGFVHPKAKSFSLTVECLSGNRAVVNGRSLGGPKGTIDVDREMNHHRQIVLIECVVPAGVLAAPIAKKNYIMSVYADHPKSAILPPELLVDKSGQKCLVDERDQMVICPMPKDKKTRLVAESDPTIRYTIESVKSGINAFVSEDIQIRLMNERPSLPFSTGGGAIQIRGVAGRHEATWPLRFTSGALIRGGKLALIGWFLAVTFAILALSLFTTLFFSTIFGVGAPFGATEVAVSSAFLMQYFCFAATFLATTSLVEVCDVIRWITFFWPSPFEWGNTRATFGDTLDLSNAVGCIFWCWTFMVVLVLFRLMVVAKCFLFDRNPSTGIQYTYPHRLTFGHWESRLAHFLVFPACTSSSFIITSAIGGIDIEPSRTCFAVFTILAALTWVFCNYYLVSRAVKEERVTWLWNNFANDNILDRESGHWVDLVCDQLNTNSVNRGVLNRTLLTWKWSVTVADIKPVALRTEGVKQMTDGETHRYGPLLAGEDVRVGRHATEVEVQNTRRPGKFCVGRKMICGLVRTNWMDLLMTYQGLTNYHSQVCNDTSSEYSMPLTVKISQLQGPVAAGTYAFFFEGVRVPFIKIEESMVKIVVGICMGVCLGLQLSAVFGEPLSKSVYVTLAVCFGLIGTGGLGSLIYASATRPFSRPMENFIYCLVQLILACSSYAFMGYSIAERQPSYFASFFVWGTAFACILLALYSCMVIFSIASSVFCPPLEETRFLERMANCVATIADHAEGWAATLPAYAKREARSVKAICQHMQPAKALHSAPQGSKILVSFVPTEDLPHFEFSVRDLKKALTTLHLACPDACLFIPSATYLGYTSKNIEPHEDVQRAAMDFLGQERMTAVFAKELSTQLTELVLAQRRTGGTARIFSITIVPAGSSPITAIENNKPLPDYASDPSRKSKSRSSGGVGHNTHSRSSTTSSSSSRGQYGEGFHWPSTSSETSAFSDRYSPHHHQAELRRHR